MDFRRIVDSAKASTTRSGSRVGLDKRASVDVAVSLETRSGRSSTSIATSRAQTADASSLHAPWTSITSKARRSSGLQTPSARRSPAFWPRSASVRWCARFAIAFVLGSDCTALPSPRVGRRRLERRYVRVRPPGGHSTRARSSAVERVPYKDKVVSAILTVPNEVNVANFKRKKCRRQVRCTLCTDVRWRGNTSLRHKGQLRRPRNEKQVAIDLE